MFSAINSIDPDGYPTFSDATELRQLVEWLPMGKEGIDYLQYKAEQNSALLKTPLKGIVKKPMLIVDALRLKGFSRKFAAADLKLTDERLFRAVLAKEEPKMTVNCSWLKGVRNFRLFSQMNALPT